MCIRDRYTSERVEASINFTEGSQTKLKYVIRSRTLNFLKKIYAHQFTCTSSNIVDLAEIQILRLELVKSALFDVFLLLANSIVLSVQFKSSFGRSYFMPLCERTRQFANKKPTNGFPIVLDEFDSPQLLFVYLPTLDPIMKHAICLILLFAFLYELLRKNQIASKQLLTFSERDPSSRAESTLLMLFKSCIILRTRRKHLKEKFLRQDSLCLLGR
eukprot:TRINITY_DN2860_c0_g1_i15.p1 TRINITY_DN2860_c0_g1~~TRINITY_DN2860_c0_g1_i15.p1  ORF type:complete len:252 (-),score=-2.46 TRINITY_DN2860_c0_g1_i15:129-776(-)